MECSTCDHCPRMASTCTYTHSRNSTYRGTHKGMCVYTKHFAIQMPDKEHTKVEKPLHIYSEHVYEVMCIHIHSLTLATLSCSILSSCLLASCIKAALSCNC